MENAKGIFTGEVDKNGKKIFYETSKLKLPDGTIGKLMFDYGQLSAYFARKDNSVIVRLKGVNNHKSFYLRNCKII